MTTQETLARALIAAGLGGSAPYTAARSLLLALQTQAGGDEPGHHAAHAAQYTRMAPAYLRELMASSNEGGRMSILARLAHAGWTLGQLVSLLPEQTKERAA